MKPRGQYAVRSKQKKMAVHCLLLTTYCLLGLRDSKETALHGSCLDVATDLAV
jgi:hypothetical protein